MKRVFELVDVLDDPRAMLERLRGFLDRTIATAEVEPVGKPPADFACFALGQLYGRFREVIVRSEILRSATVPAWFDPRVYPGQFGTIRPDGWRCYIQVKLDAAARELPSTFDERILTLAIPNPEQGSLFG